MQKSEKITTILLTTILLKPCDNFQFWNHRKHFKTEEKQKLKWLRIPTTKATKTTYISLHDSHVKTPNSNSRFHVKITTFKMFMSRHWRRAANHWHLYLAFQSYWSFDRLYFIHVKLPSLMSWLHVASGLLDSCLSSWIANHLFRCDN